MRGLYKVVLCLVSLRTCQEDFAASWVIFFSSSFLRIIPDNRLRILREVPGKSSGILRKVLRQPFCITVPTNPAFLQLRPILYSPGLRLGTSDAARSGEVRMATTTSDKFPCPVCTQPLQVRLTKKDKPYVTCDPCGVQVFIRGPMGIREFKRLIERGNRDGVFDRLKEMEQRYRLCCTECNSRFWIEPRLIKTSVFDGSMKGFRCPKCGEVVPWGQTQ